MIELSSGSEESQSEYTKENLGERDVVVGYVHIRVEADAKTRVDSPSG